MPNRILKAASVRMSAIMPHEPGIPSDSKRGQTPEAASRESEMIIAETKLITCQLLNDVKQRAEAIIDEARERGARMLEKATADARAIKEQARQAGYKTGHREGLLVLAKERKRIEGELLEQQQRLEQERLDMIRELEPALIQLALQIARKVVHAELKLFPEQVSRIAEAVLAQVRESGQVSLRTSFADKNLVAPLIEENKGRSTIEMEVDSALRSGDYVARTSFGTIDGTIDGQLGVIEHRLLEVARSD